MICLFPLGPGAAAKARLVAELLIWWWKPTLVSLATARLWRKQGFLSVKALLAEATWRPRYPTRQPCGLLPPSKAWRCMCLGAFLCRLPRTPSVNVLTLYCYFPFSQFLRNYWQLRDNQEPLSTTCLQWDSAQLGLLSGAQGRCRV